MKVASFYLFIVFERSSLARWAVESAVAAGFYCFCIFFLPAWIARMSKKCLFCLCPFKSSSYFFIWFSFIAIWVIRSSAFFWSYFFSMVRSLTSSAVFLAAFYESAIILLNFSLSSDKNFLASSSFSYSMVIYSFRRSFSSFLSLIDI